MVAMILSGWSWAVFVFQPFGDRPCSLVAVSATLAVVTVGSRRGGHVPTDQVTSPERILGRCTRLGRKIRQAALTCWLSLIVRSAIAPGGVIPTGKSNPEAIRVLTRHVLIGGTDRSANRRVSTGPETNLHLRSTP